MEAHGVSKVFTAQDGMRMGLQGMIDLMLEQCDSCVASSDATTSELALPRQLSRLEAGIESVPELRDRSRSPVLGITGTGGAGKSTLTDEFVLRFLRDFADLKVAVLSVDPTKPRTGGALLGDRIRMNAMYGEHGQDPAGNQRVFMRSLATRRAHRSVSGKLRACIDACQVAGFDLVIVETAGIGQSDTEIVEMVDVSLYVMTGDYGAGTQLEKIGMLDAADFVVLNKFDRRGSRDALRDIRKQVQRNRLAFGQRPEKMPVYPTMASRFDDPGVSRLYVHVMEALHSERMASSENPRLKYPARSQWMISSSPRGGSATLEKS